MNFTVAIIGITVILFVLGFVTKRRFGVLGLALLSGSYLAGAWAGTVVPYVEKSSLNLKSLGVPALALVTVALTLAPALILLAHSPKYYGKYQKMLGSLAFGALAGVLLTSTFASVLTIDSLGQTIDTFIVHNYTILVTVGIVLAVIDLFLSTSRPHIRHSHSEKH
ncbi:MAG TPA: hypothetical protein VFQ70_00200 [Candidatus Saccharimonadaceae bacterium]|nr:hypothetical protein [Candidatus Saccharimonadaceae bacterium]